MNNSNPCPTCGGQKTVDINTGGHNGKQSMEAFPCTTCSGTGSVPSNNTYGKPKEAKPVNSQCQCEHGTGVESKPTKGHVTSAAGGMVNIIVDRDTVSYPAEGQDVTMVPKEAKTTSDTDTNVGITGTTPGWKSVRASGGSSVMDKPFILYYIQMGNMVSVNVGNYNYNIEINKEYDKL